MVDRNKGQLALGPGTMRLAALGSPEPTDLVTPWDPAWGTIGYSEKGSKIKYELDTGKVEAAEEIDPIWIAINSRDIKVEFVMLQLTATNLRTAMNGGTISVPGVGLVRFEPHAAGEEQRLMLGFESEDGTERWIFREGLQTTNIEMDRARGNENAKIANEWQLAKPAPNVLPFAAILASPLRA